VNPRPFDALVAKLSASSTASAVRPFHQSMHHRTPDARKLVRRTSPIPGPPRRSEHPPADRPEIDIASLVQIASDALVEAYVLLACEDAVRLLCERRMDRRLNRRHYWRDCCRCSSSSDVSSIFSRRTVANERATAAAAPDGQEAFAVSGWHEKAQDGEEVLALRPSEYQPRDTAWDH
jgi:hypothetical protein